VGLPDVVLVKRGNATLLVVGYGFADCEQTRPRGGYDILTIQEILGPRDVSTTMIYTHVLNRRGRGVRSPLDR